VPSASPDPGQRRAAKIAGVAYFAIITTSIASIALGPSALTMGGAVPSTLTDIADQQLLYRAGAVYDLLMYAGVVLLSVALYRVVEPVNRGVALVGVLWRLCEAVLGCVTVVASLAVIHLASAGASGLDGALRLELVHLLLQAIGHSLSLISAFLCLGTIAFCALLYQSRLVPRGLSGWGIAGCGVMLVGALTRLVAPASGELEMVGALAVIPFEIAIGLWLWLRGVE